VLIAQITDAHVGEDGAADALAAAVGEVASFRPDAVLFTGDLTNSGADEEFRLVRELLAPLTMPVHVLAGNHDEPGLLREHFALPGADGEPLRYVATAGPLRLVMCDTRRPGRGDGTVDVAWLAAQLEADTSSPTIVALHHSPVDTGVPAMDDLGLDMASRAGFADLVARHPQVVRIVGGHVHTTVIAEVGGRVVVACPSTHLQLRLDLGARTELRLDPLPPAFALHRYENGAMSTLIRPVRPS
jgi:3',5'-cyclic-AMP phosphodiesterase